ncbi:MAG: hypothetical protein WC654_04090 [Patescibacteria group bacterium]
MEGVCSECQKVHPVHITPGVISLAEFLDDEGEAEGEEYHYVLDVHDAYGSHCDGSGTMPQAILTDKI